MLLTVALVLGACASDDIADQGNRSRAGDDKKSEAKGGKSEGKGGGKNKGGGSAANNNGEQSEDVPEEIDTAGGDTTAPGTADAPEDFGGGDAPSSGIDPSLARANASLDDPSTDAKKQGIAPQYSEAIEARIQGLGKNVRLTMTFAGSLPERVDKDKYMVMAFGITGQKEGQGYAIGATCDEKGWHPYAGSKGENQKFPGSFEVTGNQIIAVVPWKFFEGPRAFEWYASTGWYGKVANQTHWSFDSVPNEETGRFPG